MMSTRLQPVRICDGCGAEIDTDYYLHIHPTGQRILQRASTTNSERDFCCEACQAWWMAEYPISGLWGPAWDDREWWHHQMLTCDHISVKTAHNELPLVNANTHFDDPEPL
ncbi:MAG: hypothetical protein J0L63_02560 [Anaerolineae bacterium]|nr:hypothetical protein [Anaerolineae bacterium]MBN8617757.1 hypothetical protein [Anaerolineae bacterium]